MQSGAHKRAGRPCKTKRYDSILDFKVKTVKETKPKVLKFTNYNVQTQTSVERPVLETRQSRSLCTEPNRTTVEATNQQASPHPVAIQASAQPSAQQPAQQPANFEFGAENGIWDFQIFNPRAQTIREDKEEVDFDVFSWLLPEYHHAAAPNVEIPSIDASEDIEDDDDLILDNETDVFLIMKQLLNKFDKTELDFVEKLMKLKGKHTTTVGSAPEINLKSIFDEQDPLFTLLVLRMVLNQADWKTLTELVCDPSKTIVNRLRKKFGSCLLLASQIFNAANKFRQTSSKKLTTLYLSTQGLTKNGIQKLCRLGLTTTVEISKLYSQEIIRNWYLKTFSRRIEDLKAGNFVLGFDNNYFHDATPQFAGDGAFVDQIDENHDVFSRFMMKTVTIFVSFPPKTVIPAFERSADFFENDLLGLTNTQHNSLINFMGDVVEESMKENGSLFFFKSSNPQNSNQINYVPDADGFCYLTLASKLGGDDSVTNMKEIIDCAQKELKGLFNVDVSEKDFLYMCDGKGYRLRAGLESSGELDQKTTIGDLHVEINLHEALMDLFYDNFISKYTPFLGFTKSFRNPQATDTKKIRMILAALLMFSLLSIVCHSGEAFPTYSKSLFPNIWTWAKAKTAAAKYAFLSQGATGPSQSSQVDEELLNDSCTCAVLNEKIKCKQLQKHGAQRKAELIAILWKDDAAKKGETLIFPSDKAWLEKQSSLYLQAMCAVDGVSFGRSDQNRQRMINYLHTKSLRGDQFDFSTRDLGTFVTFIKYAILPYAFHCAVRTGNWDLRIAVLKMSVDLFQRVGKTQYVDLATKHLRDLKEAFSTHNCSNSEEGPLGLIKNEPS